MSEIEVYETHETAAPATLFRTDDPAEVAARAIATADALMGVVNQRRRDLISVISGKDYPQVECWTLLGTLLGVFPVCEWTRPITDSEGTVLGWEARVVAKTRDGSVVGAAESMCMFSERTWANRESFALRGMAESRATSRAMRKPLGFVMKLAGLEATAAEEMDGMAVKPPPAALQATEEEIQAYRDEVEAAGFAWEPALNALTADSGGSVIFIDVLQKHEQQLEKTRVRA